MSDNGMTVIRIGSKGKATFGIGDTGKPFTIDVVLVQLQWIEVDRSFRNDESRIPPDAMMSYNQAAWQFVRDLCGHDITLAEALDFLARLTEEGTRLRDFFEPKLPEKRSLPDSTELTFSE